MNRFYFIVLLLSLLVVSASGQDYSLNFDGNSYVSIPHNDTLNLGNQLTIECWFTVQGPSINDWIGIVCKLEATSVAYSGYFFGLSQTAALPNQIHFRIYPSLEYIDSSFSPTLNHWYNLAVTYNGSVMRIFLDGNLIREKTATGLIASNTFPLTIGGQNGTFWNRNLNGKIDEVRISSVARYDANFTPTTYFDNDINTIALYHFDEGVGDTLYDSSGNDLEGVIYGAAWNNGVTPVDPEVVTNPDRFVLFNNFPNPFNPKTVISYQLTVSSEVTLKVFDVLGNEIATLVDEYKTAGCYTVEFTINNLQLSSGVYFYQLKAGEFISTKKMILLK